MTNSVPSIALHRMKLQARRLHRIKAHGCGHVISSRELVPTEQSRAEHDQRWPTPTLLWMWRWANMILTCITLRQYRSLLYELLYELSFSNGSSGALRVTLRVQAIQSLLYESCATGGKPSTRLPPGELVEQLWSSHSSLESP